MSKRKRQRSREFKEAAVARMESAETAQALADELGIYRGLLFKWRRGLSSGGAFALRPSGRPAKVRVATDIVAPSAVPADFTAARQRIEELERKIGQQQQDLDFFRAALRHVGEQRPKQDEPGETASSR